MNRDVTRYCWLLLAALVVGGCETDGSSHEEYFGRTDEPRVYQAMRAQAAAGAAEEATLYDDHFTGSRLNTLGLAKLDRMLIDAGDRAPDTVWLDLAADDPVTALRVMSVETYIEKVGFEPLRYSVEVGTNPGAVKPAAPNIAALPGVDQSKAGDGAPASGTSTEMSPVLP